VPTFTITIDDGVLRLPAVMRSAPALLARTTRGLLHRSGRHLAAAAQPSASALPGADRPRLAVLIDADNAQAARIGPVLREIATVGTATVTRAYGDWSSTSLTAWKGQLPVHAIDAVQVFASVKGKNATDGALMIDAMDLLYAGGLDGVCLVSSDSDFTRLATRLRQAGLFVHGFGHRKTPASFVDACTRFVHVEDLAVDEPSPTRPKPPVRRKAPARPTGPTTAVTVPAQRTPNPALRGDTKLVSRLRAAVEAARDADGWSNQARVCSLLRQSPAVDPQAYGYQKLADLVTAVDLFETSRRPSQSGKATTIYLKDKRRRSAAGTSEP